MTLILRGIHLGNVKAHSLESFPVEACGIMVGRVNENTKIVEKTYRTKNVLNSSHEYEIDPSEQLSIFQEAEDQSLEVIGFYHSHPYGEAKPSTIDKSLAFYPNFSYAIYSVITNDLSSFTWNGKAFTPELVKIL